jgi:hypothetical protein
MVEPRLLLLRLWPDETAFRAVVREFEPEQSRHFDDPQALVDYVLRPRPSASAPAPARPPAITQGAHRRNAR